MSGLAFLAVSSGAAVSADSQRAVLSNQLVQIHFNAAEGEYDLLDAQSNVIVKNATLKINDWSFSEPSYTCTWQTEPINDALGGGQTLRIIGTASESPTLYLEISLYADNGFVVFDAGLKNTMGQPVRIMEIHPMANAAAFEGFDMSAYFSMLDGNSGGDLTRVSHGDERVSDNNLLVTFGPQGANRSIVFGGLTYHEFEKFAQAKKQHNGLAFEVYSKDPVGKRVDPGATCLPDEKYYLDFTMNCPFEALERYARTVRSAQGVELACYDFPTLCLWYSSFEIFGGGRHSNDSVGAVWEMDQVVKRDFLKYSRVAIRLVPDNYGLNNQQGWWDDEHWQMYQGLGEGNTYREPYETTEKWGKAITKRGGIPLMYCQSGRRSEDYANRFPGHILFNNDPNIDMRGYEFPWNKAAGIQSRWGYDYTDPDFAAHMKEVYKNLRKGGIRGWMFDYPETAFPWQGGMEDQYSTAAGAYRKMFELAAEGFGKPHYVHERNLGVGSDVTVGVVASQRTMGDTDRLNPVIITTPGLRWYKNRVLYNYDTDGKNPFHALPDGPDGVRAMFTMMYVASSRLLLACSFARMTDEHLYILSRVLPFHSQPQSARPLDAFVTNQNFPRVYDFKINPDWHQLTFYNTAVSEGSWSSDWEYLSQHADAVVPAQDTISVDLGAPPAFGGLGLHSASRYYVYDFWNDRLVGEFLGNQKLEQTLRPGEARMMSVHKIEPNPQFISANRHIMQGYVEMTRYPQWDEKNNTLSGVSNVVGGETYKVIIAANGYEPKKCSARGATSKMRSFDPKKELIELSIDAPSNQEIEWAVLFH